LAREFHYTPLDEALRALSKNVVRKEQVEDVDVRSAYGRVLGSDLVAKEDVPPRDVSHFDGFAIRSADSSNASRRAPMVLSLKRGVFRLGILPRGRLRSGEAMNVATGGYLPEGADAVVPVEEAARSTGKIELSHPVRRGDYVYAAGRDVRKGERVLRAGLTLKGQHLALLASLYTPKVSVRKKPRVAIIPTGTELTADIGDNKSGKVVESHSLLLSNLIDEAGGEAVNIGIVPDERKALTRALRDALTQADIVLTLAGSSVGEPDIVDSTIAGFGSSTKIFVHGIKVQRGRVMGFAVVAEKPVVVLPGPIQGALNAFILFGYPLIRNHLGLGFEEPPTIHAIIGEDWEASGKFKDFDQVVYLELKSRGSGDAAQFLAIPSSGETEKMSFLASKNGYTVVSGKRPSLDKGQPVWVHLLPGFSTLD
jgi:molybdopterin molybdotransferase